ncbi:hypothetical protein CKAH01_12527 [Colletotrichum kahawae]|uniref:Uncharacterized protein n=1 Tax=Colletotrichum kahawae TaxID=34407 RepID=A0AAD9YRD7_COLKA|nr:hypothetical protein CKAH01_12527 [Colletotrichum kahawae]
MEEEGGRRGVEAFWWEGGGKEGDSRVVRELRVSAHQSRPPVRGASPRTAPVQPLSGRDRAWPAVVRSTMDEASAGLETPIVRRLRVSKVGMTPLRAVWVKHRSKQTMAISERVRQIPSPLP